MKEKLRFLGLDVHAETIAVAIAEPEGEVRSLGTIPPCPVLPFGIRGDLGDEGADLLVVASQAEEGAIEVGVVGARIVARQFAAKESRPHSIHIPGSVVVGQQDRGDGSITLCNDVYPFLVTSELNGEELFTLGQRLEPV